MKMTNRKQVILLCLSAIVVLQVGTYLLFASFTIPDIALRLTPEHTHFVKGTTFSWVWLQADRCENLTDRQKVRLRSLVRYRYHTVYDTESDIPKNLIFHDPEGKWAGYDDGFSYRFSVLFRGPFWVKVSHGDHEGNLAASFGEHVYVWVLCMWVKLYDGPMAVS